MAWLKVSRREWRTVPHAEARPEGLLWYRGEHDAANVVNAYLEGRKNVPEEFRDDLLRYLRDLCERQTLEEWGKPRTKKY